MKGKLIIFSGPSGSGKTSIVKFLLSKNLNLSFSVSACSREKRKNEVHGKDYLFISVNDFKQKINNKEFLEWEEVYENNFYGTLKSEVEKNLDTGKNVIFDIDVIGGLNIKKIYTNSALTIFVKPPNIDELKKRLISRSTESEEKLNKRISKAKYEISFADKFDKLIINDKLNEAEEEAFEIVNQYLF
ncbi:MAG: guanylate kinase [Bacteroidetes bacterium]|jgi:guanylate kinase|nr:guanylate kinase [Bacteroidota bacterium]MBT6684717.1 guanylate kinase [Bacteroidota bacterium]MBT7143157.1 guanylate kinase [Bacteroidota bacterium]MBT7492600.1 guanylate kinase [Bacteroidota bacterium]